MVAPSPRRHHHAARGSNTRPTGVVAALTLGVGGIPRVTPAPSQERWSSFSRPLRASARLRQRRSSDPPHLGAVQVMDSDVLVIWLPSQSDSGPHLSRRGGG